VIENAIDLEAFDTAARQGPAGGVWDHLSDRFVIVQAGRLEPQKGVADLLSAIDEVRQSAPEVMLLLAGDGPDRPDLERRVEALDLAAHVRFLGVRSDVPALLARSDVVVLASRWEGLPNVVLEGMAASRPVVVTDVGGCSELVEDGRTGTVVPPGRASQLAAAISALRDDPAGRDDLGRAARREVEARFSVARMVTAYQDLYLELLEGTTRGTQR